MCPLQFAISLKIHLLLMTCLFGRGFRRYASNLSLFIPRVLHLASESGSTCFSNSSDSSSILGSFTSILALRLSLWITAVLSYVSLKELALFNREDDVSVQFYFILFRILNSVIFNFIIVTEKSEVFLFEAVSCVSYWLVPRTNSQCHPVFSVYFNSEELGSRIEFSITRNVC